MRRGLPALLVAVILLLGAATGLLVAAKGRAPVPPVAPTGCPALATGVRQTVDLRTGSTTFGVGVGIDVPAGPGLFDRGVPFSVATAPAPGLVAVHLLESATGDRLYTADVGNLDASDQDRYVDRGVVFFALSEAGDCAAPVHRLELDGRHQYAGSGNVRSDLEAEGWREDGVAFFAVTSTARAARPVTEPGAAAVVPAAPGSFTVAVVPDTQQEVLSADDDRLSDRNRWLVAQQQDLDLRFVAHVGDVVNWDTADHVQYERARRAMQVLGAAEVPYAIAPGNHDAQATCVGGSACPDTDLAAALRDTTTLNRYFPSTAFAALQGEFEPGKADNSFHTFSAEGKQFLVLVVEMGPRAGALRWARSVVESHPQHNVIVLTHYHLTATGVVAQASGYGERPPTELVEQLVEPYPNVKVVLSGHVGTGAVRRDRTAAGEVVSYLQCFHDNETNPVRLLRIDVAGGSISSTVFAPATTVSYPELATPSVRVDWV